MAFCGSKLDIISLVAPNGLGHFRRQIEILSRVLAMAPAIHIHVLCAQFQFAITRDWDLAVRFFADPRVTWSEGVLDPGVGWSVDARRYDDGRLSAWMERLGRVPELSQARLVISDNLAGVLAYRDDAILAGSFLWGDILAAAHPQSEAIRSFALQERTLLDRHKPHMICVRDVAMPAVTQYTTAVALDWMCEHGVASRRAEPRIARIGLLGGASGAADALLTRLAQALAQQGRYELALPSTLSAAVPGAISFHHRREDYAQLSLAVCRPGMGTVTACITEGVPMISLHEGQSNPELDFISARLADLGIAVNAGADPHPQTVAVAVESVLQEPLGSRMRDRLLTLPREGLDQAANWIANRL
jgi:hypothetical protein